MSVIVILIFVGIIVAGGFLIGFIWAVRSGQYDDTYSPAVRMLFDDDTPSDSSQKEENKQETKTN